MKDKAMLSKNNQDRLAAYFDWTKEEKHLASAEKSGHWQYFSETQASDPGSGFDRDWTALNSPGQYPGKLRAIKAEMALRFQSAASSLAGAQSKRLARAFISTWGHNPPLPLSSVQRIRNRYVPISLSAANSANSILSTFNTIQPQKTFGKVVEIGSGSGYLTHYLMEKLRPNTIFILDLPEVIPLCLTNLIRLDPSLEFALPNELNGSSNYSKINFLTPSQKFMIEEKSIDMFVNTASMQEMFPEVIEDYFSWIRSRANRAGSYFYCSNRVEKWLSQQIGNSDGAEAVRDIPVRFAEYPWIEGEADLLYRISRYHRLIAAEPVQERLVRLR